jgi:hypothetical protein
MLAGNVLGDRPMMPSSGQVTVRVYGRAYSQAPGPSGSHSGKDVEAILRKIAITAGDDRLIPIAAAVLGPAAVSRRFETLEILAQDEVDDAGDRVGAIDRRGARPSGSRRSTAESGIELTSTAPPSKAKLRRGVRSAAPVSSRCRCRAG